MQLNKTLAILYFNYLKYHLHYYILCEQKVAVCNRFISFSHLSLDLPNCLPVRPSPLKPYLHFSTPYVPRGQPITFSFISSTQFCFASCTNHQTPLYVNLSSPSTPLQSNSPQAPHNNKHCGVAIYFNVYCSL